MKIRDYVTQKLKDAQPTKQVILRVKNLPDGWPPKSGPYAGRYDVDMTITSSEIIIEALEPSPNMTHILDEVAQILNIIPEIQQAKSYRDGQNNKIAQIQSELRGVQIKTAEQQSEINRINLLVNNFNIANTVSNYNPNQKAHILQKVWGARDNDTLNIINAIKQQGFNPHYVKQDGKGLIHLALSSNDQPLFSLLMSNKLNFNQVINNKSVFELVLASNNQGFIKAMIDSRQDFSKVGALIVAHDDVVMTTKALTHNKEFSKLKYAGYPLLQLAIKNASYNAAEAILKVDSSSATALNDKGLSALQFSLIIKNVEGTKLLQKYNADLVTIDEQGNYIIHWAAMKGYDQAIGILLNNRGTLIDLKNAQSENSVLHSAADKGQAKVIIKLLEFKPELVNTVDKQDHTVLYKPLLNNLDETIKLLLAAGNGKLVAQTLSQALDNGDHTTMISNLIPHVKPDQVYNILDNIIKHTSNEKANVLLSDINSQHPEFLKQLDMEGKSVLYKALVQEKNTIFADLLLGYGADMKQVIKTAAAHQDIDGIKQLISFKAGQLTSIVLTELVQADSPMIKELLLTQPQLISTTCEQENNLLHLSCLYGKLELAQTSLQTCPELINKQNANGQTPLHILLDNYSSETAIQMELTKLLLTYHPDIEIKDCAEHSIKELATDHNPEILAMLYEQGLLGEGTQEHPS